MLEVDVTNADRYLRDVGRVGQRELVDVRELAGGVSNIVLLVTLPDRGERFVLKQARGRLRVKEDWRCPVERIWREVETLRVCGELLANRSQPRSDWEPAVPQVLWEDRDQYLYAMTAAPAEHQTWKQLLLAGPDKTHEPLARACGRFLAAIHRGAWREAAVAAQFEDRAYFDQLRLDPYYRQIARVHPDLAEPIEHLIQSIEQNRLTLVHGDFSPKNLLVWPGHVMLIDYEVGHYGDPAFDLGFFLTHLVLKSVWAGEQRRAYLPLVSAFWSSYGEQMSTAIEHEALDRLERRAVLNLAGCLLARVDGKSPVDYLTPEQQALVRQMARRWLAEPPAHMHSAVADLGRQPTK